MYSKIYEQYKRNYPNIDIQGLSAYKIEELTDLIYLDLLDFFQENDINIGSFKIAIVGSRVKGMAKEDSDLDILLEYYSMDYSEDDLFNILNEKPLYIDGILLDINPINPNKSYSIEEWMQHNYDHINSRKLNNITPILDW